MSMLISHQYLSVKKILGYCLVLFFLVFGATLMSASMASAVGDVPVFDGGAGGGNDSPFRPTQPTNPSPNPAPAPSPGGNGGDVGGGGGSSWGSSSVYYDGPHGSCARFSTDVGGRTVYYNAVGHRVLYQSQYLIGTGTSPEPGAVYIGPHHEGGIAWLVKRQTGIECIYPVTSTTVQSITCLIKIKLDVTMLSPVRKNDPNSYVGNSAYREGTKNISTCSESAKGYSFGIMRRVTEYGYYQATGTHYKVNMNIYTTTFTNPATGASTQEQEIVLGSPFWGAPRVLTTFSLHCKNGFNHSPGVWASNWTEQPCESTNTVNPSHKCNANPIQYDVNDGTGKTWKTFSGNKVQFLRDGKARQMNFDQYITGKNVSVNSYRTRFVRTPTSTPWDSSKGYNKNLFELRKNLGEGSILTQGAGTSSPWYNSKVNTLFASGYSASESGSPTKIQQEINWSGTRTITSYQITGITGSGGVTYAPITVKVPTSGTCVQEANIDYIRAIGHEAG